MPILQLRPRETVLTRARGNPPESGSSPQRRRPRQVDPRPVLDEEPARAAGAARAACQSLSRNSPGSEQVPGRAPGKAAGAPHGGAMRGDENTAGHRPGAAQRRSGSSETGSQRALTREPAHSHHQLPPRPLIALRRLHVRQFDNEASPESAQQPQGPVQQQRGHAGLELGQVGPLNARLLGCYQHTRSPDHGVQILTHRVRVVATPGHTSSRPSEQGRPQKDTGAHHSMLTTGE